MGREISDSEILRFLDAVNAQLRRSGIFIQSVTYSRAREDERTQIINFNDSQHGQEDKNHIDSRGV